MSNYLIQRINVSTRIPLHMCTEVEACIEDDYASEVVLIHYRTSQRSMYVAAGVFVMIGATPNTDWLHTIAKLHGHGFVLTGASVSSGDLHFATSSQRVFPVGDVRSGSVKRVASAVGEGSVVIPEGHRYLTTVNESPHL